MNNKILVVTEILHGELNHTENAFKFNYTKINSNKVFDEEVLAKRFLNQKMKNGQLAPLPFLTMRNGYNFLNTFISNKFKYQILLNLLNLCCVCLEFLRP